jgi:hypothetical protein
MHAPGGRPGVRPWAACSPVWAAASAAGNGQNAGAASGPPPLYSCAQGEVLAPRSSPVNRARRPARLRPPSSAPPEAIRRRAPMENSRCRNGSGSTNA